MKNPATTTPTRLMSPDALHTSGQADQRGVTERRYQPEDRIGLQSCHAPQWISTGL